MVYGRPTTRTARDHSVGHRMQPSKFACRKVDAWRRQSGEDGLRPARGFEALFQSIKASPAVSQGWTPDKAIYGNNFIPNEKIKDKLIELGNENGIAKFWFAGTGEVVYVGSPKIKISDNSNKN